jgi:hemerythrin-like domain-containing protein
LNNRATNNLKEDHILIRRLRNVVKVCSEKLFANIEIPIEDIEIISVVMEEFVDRFHHGKEEKAYFPETQDKDGFSEDIRKFLIEHELGRRIAMMLRREINNWKNNEIKTIEPIARFLKSYSVFIDEHTMKEDSFFDMITAKNSISEKEDEKLLKHYELCVNNVSGIERLKQAVKLIEFLENRTWMNDNTIHN